LNLPSSPSIIGHEWEGNVTVCDSQCDLLEMPAVKQLERDSKYGSVYRLLEIFLTGRLSDYLDFQAADAATLKNYGLRSSLAIFLHYHEHALCFIFGIHRGIHV